MKILDRFSRAWAALTGKRSDPYAGTYGVGGAHGFAGGSIGRLTAGLANWSGSVNADLDLSLPILRARARHLAANNEYGKRFLSLVAINVVGRSNPRLQVRATQIPTGRNAKPILDKAANDAIEIHYERWGRTADITGRHRTLPAFWRMVVKAVARDGEALVRVVRNSKLPYGMALQALEADRLDDRRNVRLDNGNVIRQGVELDSTGRAIAYWIRTAHPGENYATSVAGFERVPAGEMYHLFTADRAEQVRGVTWFHAVIIRASTIHRFEDAAVVAAEIGASKIAALERSDDAPDGGALAMADGTSDGSARGIPQMSVQAGEMFELPPGYKLNSWNPEYPHANFESFLKACLRGLAAGFDVAAHNLTADMTDVNYSSARIAELGEREVWLCLQDWFIATLVQPLFEDWLALALLRKDITFEVSGKALPADKFAKFATAARFQGRRWSWVDPLKEMEASAAGVQLGVTSRTRIAAEQGDDFDDILDELAQETAALESAGLSTDVKPSAQPTPVTPAEPAPANGGGKSARAQESAMEKRVSALEAQARATPAPQTVFGPGSIVFPAVENHFTLPETTRDAAPTTIENHIHVPAPVVNVEAPTVTVESAQVVLEAVLPAPEIRMPARRTETTIHHDADGEITGSTAIEADV